MQSRSEIAETKVDETKASNAHVDGEIGLTLTLTLTPLSSVFFFVIRHRSKISSYTHTSAAAAETAAIYTCTTWTRLQLNA